MPNSGNLPPVARPVHCSPATPSLNHRTILVSRTSQSERATYRSGPAISAANVSAIPSTAACTGPDVIEGITDESTM
jgi:hypothetical protein